MLKLFLFNAGLFCLVSYLGYKNDVDCLVLAVIFAVLHHYLRSVVDRLEFFTLPDSRPIPDCPRGMERAKNGMDCKSKGDLHGM
jgi:hypothetical protein